MLSDPFRLFSTLYDLFSRFFLPVLEQCAWTISDPFGCFQPFSSVFELGEDISALFDPF